MDRNVNESFKFNQETEMVPILGLISAQLNAPTNEKKSDEDKLVSSLRDDHHPALLSLLADELSVIPEKIHDFELCVHFLYARISD